MNEEKLFRAISDIRDEYIEEASPENPYVPEKTSFLLKFRPIAGKLTAAAACLLVAGGVLALQKARLSSPETAPVEVIQENEEALEEQTAAKPEADVLYQKTADANAVSAVPEAENVPAVLSEEIDGLAVSAPYRFVYMDSSVSQEALASAPAAGGNVPAAKFASGTGESFSDESGQEAPASASPQQHTVFYAATEENAIRSKQTASSAGTDAASSEEPAASFPKQLLQYTLAADADGNMDQAAYQDADGKTAFLLIRETEPAPEISDMDSFDTGSGTFSATTQASANQPAQQETAPDLEEQSETVPVYLSGTADRITSASWSEGGRTFVLSVQMEDGISAEELSNILDILFE